jgi:hypothetical protein
MHLEAAIHGNRRKRLDFHPHQLLRAYASLREPNPDRLARTTAEREVSR